MVRWYIAGKGKNCVFMSMPLSVLAQSAVIRSLGSQHREINLFRSSRFSLHSVLAIVIMRRDEAINFNKQQKGAQNALVCRQHRWRKSGGMMKPGWEEGAFVLWAHWDALCGFLRKEKSDFSSVISNLTTWLGEIEEYFSNPSTKLVSVAWLWGSFTSLVSSGSIVSTRKSSFA